MYKYHSVQELAQYSNNIVEHRWIPIRMEIGWVKVQLIHFKIIAHGEIVRETTCGIYTIEIKTYDLEPDVQKWFRDPWYICHANIALPSENGHDARW